ncbi:hypothetical protein [Neptuniibacter sp. QD37_11]|uniref:hypothetical protein n=1 Tax=Neptuniibacter sp. QD37_11 TaxID=3398209 RepID=UPI0039F5B398
MSAFAYHRIVNLISNNSTADVAMLADQLAKDFDDKDPSEIIEPFAEAIKELSNSYSYATAQLAARVFPQLLECMDQSSTPAE